MIDALGGGDVRLVEVVEDPLFLRPVQIPIVALSFSPLPSFHRFQDAVLECRLELYPRSVSQSVVSSHPPSRRS